MQRKAAVIIPLYIFLLRVKIILLPIILILVLKSHLFARKLYLLFTNIIKILKQQFINKSNKNIRHLVTRNKEDQMTHLLDYGARLAKCTVYSVRNRFCMAFCTVFSSRTHIWKYIAHN